MRSVYKRLSIIIIVSIFAFFSNCQQENVPIDNPALVGTWKSHINFESGSFSSIKDLEFMYAFNAGGTMTESSNYDMAPPVPPAYGVWRMLGLDRYEAQYEFYMTRQPASKEEATTANGGWLPGGYGLLIEQIKLSEDGNSFNSTIRLKMFDQKGKAASDSGYGTGHGVRLSFK